MADAYNMTGQKWQNRIVGYDNVPPDQLLANPMNFRVHPKRQQDALNGSLNELGWLQDIIVNRVTDHVLDGHLRVQLALRNAEPTVPVKYVEISEDEERLALAIFDPITYMAETDAAQLDALLQQVNTGEAALQAVLSELAEGVTLPDAGEWGDAFGKLPDEDRAPFQQMTFTLHDTQAEQVKRAIAAAGKLGDFADSPNANSHGNALAFMAELFLTEHGDGCS